jgi:ATP synthase subunit 6
MKIAKDMIISPLEQFNICPLWAVSIADASSFDIIYAKLLICAWSLVDFASTNFTNTTNVVGALQAPKALIFILSTAIMPLSVVADTLLVLIFYVISTFVFIYSILIGTLIADIYRNTLGYIESINTTSVLSAPLSSTNETLYVIPFHDGSMGTVIASGYFMMTELFLEIWNFICGCTANQLFNLSTKDFSYLIFSFNTSSVWLLFITGFTAFLFRTTLTHAFIIPKNSWQAGLEATYSVILGVVNENAGPKLVKYFPLIFTIFIIILTCNLLGMIPYSFTVTSHLIVTFCTALAGFIGLNIIGIMKNRTHFLSLFFPPGAPMALAPLLVFIEFVSYVFRVLSLAIRLFANLMSGHTLLKILSGFAWAAVSFWGIYLIPLIIIFLVTGLELGIAMIQAYIFSVLLCIYLNDAVNLH